MFIRRCTPRTTEIDIHAASLGSSRWGFRKTFSLPARIHQSRIGLLSTWNRRNSGGNVPTGNFPRSNRSCMNCIRVRGGRRKPRQICDANRSSLQLTFQAYWTVSRINHNFCFISLRDNFLAACSRINFESSERLIHRRRCAISRARVQSSSQATHSGPSFVFCGRLKMDFIVSLLQH